MRLQGSCHCQAVTFSVETLAPYPYARCYCSICRKTAGSGGFGIFMIAQADTLEIDGEDNIAKYHAKLEDGGISLAERCFCMICGSQLWLFDPRWPTHLHPHASAFDTSLPKPPAHMDYFVASAAPWVEFHDGADIERIDGPYTVGMEDWHRDRGLLADT